MNEWTIGDFVVKGYWYERLQLGNQLYQLRNDKPLAFFFTNLVLTSRFSMPASIHSIKGTYVKYEFTNEVATVIVEALEAFNLLN
jgi:hypothetical protein